MSDGQYIERSTVTYNTVIDRALTVMAAKLKRPELLDPVRRNLRAMLYLMHPDGEVVTEVSRRQDQFTRGTMAGYWFPASYLAAHDRDRLHGRRWSHAMPAEAPRLSTLLEYPELAVAAAGREGAARRLRKAVPAALRWRASGAGSATRRWC